ncbi:MAG: hypothetical protein LW623_10215 [Sphingomonadaceae bacterium]|jgi:hypothetical protein|uniref:hypothetical protein n=1 Tax=Sphingorhabdus sp. TaxID=1902408 RepID=UPI0039BC422E|nr:hypothetical protein [Sphingomonadaceae bacterium]
MSELKLQTTVPLDSLRVLLAFAKGDHKLDQCVAAAGLNVLSYAMGFVLPEHGAEPAAAEGAQAVAAQSVVDELQAAITQAEEPAAAGAIQIDWKKLAEFVITVIVKAVL